MKLQHKNVELITEYAKDLVYSQNVEFLANHQEFVFAEQYRRQRILANTVDWAVTDNPLLLSHVYGRLNNTSVPQGFYEYTTNSFDSFDNINFFLKRPNKFQQIGRVHTLEESLHIDTIILEMFEHLNVKYVEIAVGDDTVDKIIECL